MDSRQATEPHSYWDLIALPETSLEEVANRRGWRWSPAVPHVVRGEPERVTIRPEGEWDSAPIDDAVMLVESFPLQAMLELSLRPELFPALPWLIESSESGNALVSVPADLRKLATRAASRVGVEKLPRGPRGTTWYLRANGVGVGFDIPKLPRTKKALLPLRELWVVLLEMRDRCRRAETPRDLQQAAEMGNELALEHLLTVDVDERPPSVLSAALRGGHDACVSLLLDTGWDAREQDERELLTALELAAARCRPETLERVAGFGWSKKQQASARRVAAAARTKPLDAGLTPPQRWLLEIFRGGARAFEFGAMLNQFDASYLSDEDLEARAADLVSKVGRGPTKDEARAVPAQTFFGMGPPLWGWAPMLALAASAGSELVVEALLTHDLYDDQALTDALVAAVAHERLGAVTRLLESGADPNGVSELEDYPRDSATDLAIYRSPALLKLMLDAGGCIAAYFDAKGKLKTHRWLGNTYTKENHKLMRKVFRQRSRQCS